MEPLLSALIAALLAETGDKTQLVVAALAAHFGRPGPVLGGVACAAGANAALMSFGGALVSPMLTGEAATLLLALALLFAAGGALRPVKMPTVEGWRLGAIISSMLAFGLAEFGDKTQFLTFAIAARSDAPILAGIGATLGVVAVSAATSRGAQLSRESPGSRVGRSRRSPRCSARSPSYPLCASPDA